AALFAVLAACGGGGGGGGGGDGSGDGGGASADRTFSHDDFSISFKYPGYLKRGRVTEVAESAGGEPVAQTALAIDEANAIFLAKYEVNAEVDEDNIAAFAPRVDELVQQLTGEPVSGQTTRVGGFPAIRYDDVDLTTPPQGQSRLVFLFDGAVEYLVNCQSTPEERDAITRGCDRVLTTMSRA
ncbi:MAG TPA: hypothetical protein VHF00_08295, partial [Acidimicrobiales bacterium]|nr:hypothetical protein [Acidimicrobiales bacterium]